MFSQGVREKKISNSHHKHARLSYQKDNRELTSKEQ